MTSALVALVVNGHHAQAFWIRTVVGCSSTKLTWSRQTQKTGQGKNMTGLHCAIGLSHCFLTLGFACLKPRFCKQARSSMNMTTASAAPPRPAAGNGLRFNHMRHDRSAWP